MRRRVFLTVLPAGLALGLGVGGGDKACKQTPEDSLSDKDREDLEFVCSLGVDWLALSFVQRAKETRK